MTEEADVVMGSLSTELREAHTKLMKSRIKLSPVHSVRSSSIGHDCDMFLFLEQTAHEKKVAHDESLQALFDLGNEMERYTVRLLEDMGYVVENRNHAFHDRENNITGHLDGRLWKRGWQRRIPIEIKGLNPYTAESITGLADIQHSRQRWVRKYYSQLMIYEHLDTAPFGLFVLLNKSTGRPEFIEAPFDRDHVEELKAKAMRIKHAIASGEPPARTRSADCARCPFVHVCLPDIDYGMPAQLMDAPELIEAIRIREANREARKNFEAADRVIKTYMPKTPGELLIGPWAATGTQRQRDGYEAKPTSWVEWKIRAVGPMPTEPPLLNPFAPGQQTIDVKPTAARPAISLVPTPQPTEESDDFR